jgi:regulator of sigma E protease
MSFIISLLVISFLIFFHELGHFLAARLMGVRVDVFSIGFGKKLISKKFGDTQWSISAIPLGGYVQMKGQDDSDPTKVSYDDDSYTVKKPIQKIFILLAGPFANFLLAFLLYFTMANIGIPKALAVVGGFSEISVAKDAGFLKGDKIIEIDNQRVYYWDDIGEIIQKSDNKMHFVIQRDLKLLDFDIQAKVMSVKNLFGEDIERKLIGIGASGDSEVVYYGIIDGFSYAIDKTIWATTYIFQSIQKLISGVVGLDQLGGIITIVDVTAQASNMGILALLGFMAIISVNLGVLNLLPIPALDGGHIMFNLYEMITKKSPSDIAMYRFTIAGWIMLFGLMFIGLYNDINRLIG